MKKITFVYENVNNTLPRQTAEAFGITLRTLANYLRRNREACLAPKPRRSSPTLIDNQKLRFFIQEHPDAYLREIAEDFGCTIQAVFYACKSLKISLKKRHPILFLPPYSPDFNPIEKFWANMKRWIKDKINNYHSLYETLVHYFTIPMST